MARPPDFAKERERGTRRSFMVDPTRFGLDRDAPWMSAVGLSAPQLVELVAAYLQHLAVCAVRERYKKRSLDDVGMFLHEHLVEHGFIEDSKTGAHNLARILNGSRPASNLQLLEWAIALSEVSIFPVAPDLFALFPPGSLPDSEDDAAALSDEDETRAYLEAALEVAREHYRRNHPR